MLSLRLLEWGKDSIANWAVRDIIGERLMLGVVKVVEH
jgi:hypothetical protein